MGWQEDPIVHKKVEDQLKKPEKKAAVERTLQMKKSNSENRSNSPKDDNRKEISHQGFALSAFTALNKNNEYLLRDSFILDLGADTHVCNDTTRVIGPIRLAPPGECLAAGNGWISVIGYGEISVKAKAPTPRNQQTVKLHNVAFVPSFFTNVVSLKKLIRGGID